VPGGDFFGYIDPDGDGWHTSGDFAFKNQGETKAIGINGRLEWDLGGDTQLVAITDWKNYKKALFIDVDSAPVNQLANFGAVDADSYSQEVRDHRAVASAVSHGWADAGICMRAVAAEAHLGFLRLHGEAYELCVAESMLDDPRIVALSATLRSQRYRQWIGDVPGCMARDTSMQRLVR